jgi:hypothetical protein
MASFSIFCNELFVMEKLLPQTVSIQEFWTGALYEYDAPAAVSLFVQLLLDLQEERKSLDGVDDYLKVNRRTAEDADHHIIEEPFELFIQRLAEHHADHPFEDGYNLGFVGTAIKISAPYQIVAKYGVEGKEEEIKESSKNFRVLHLLYLSYLLKVPIDFFLVPNYADYTISHMNLKLKNGTAKTEDITTVPNLAAKVKSFASMTPEKQKELLQLLVKRILNDSTKIGLARG